MDLILNVLERLSIDKTIIPTFFIVVIFYLIISNLFFKKLLHVIVNREGKTTKLEGLANQKAHEAEQLKNDYKERMNEAYAESQNELKMMKAKEMQAKKDKYLDAEKNINQKADNKLADEMTELSKKKAKIMSAAEQLSEILVDKLT
ncbi:MAG: hypothetical protein E2O68_07135 [Deltaproteobacteria bacterium]|nr:MAG: hypothetical protein E2O68_07135 [Deltaproteobacteria bacterium]